MEKIKDYTFRGYIEKHNKDNLHIISQEEFLEKHPIFENIIKNCINRWVNKICFTQNIFDGECFETLRLYSVKREYFITIHKDRYIGGTYNNRYTYPFENHHRGNDLSDGKYNIETICNILADIVACEIEEIIIDEKVFNINKK